MISVNELAAQVYNELAGMGYSQSRMEIFAFDLAMIGKFFRKRGYSDYSLDIAQELVNEKFTLFEEGKISRHRFNVLRKTTYYLEQFAQHGKIEWKQIDRWDEIKLQPAFSELLKAYLKYRENSLYPSTLASHRNLLRHFFQYLEQQGYGDLSQVRPSVIGRYLVCRSDLPPVGLRGDINVLRSFFKFINEKGLSKYDFLPALRIRAAKSKRLIRYFTHEQAHRIIEAVDLNAPNGRRDYAILLLAKTTGLRASDMVELQLNQINWTIGEIHIVQHKTEHFLDLPLVPVAINAILDYIQNERPANSSPYVFLRSFAPDDGKLSPTTMGLIVRKYAKAAGLILEPQTGFHCFRRSLGTWMLEAEVPLATISQVLGHAGTDATTPYLSMDTKRLRECALGLAGISVTMEGLQ